MKYTKLPIMIEAIQFNGAESVGEMHREWDGVGFSEYCSMSEKMAGGMYMHTLEGIMNCCLGDWIIRGVEGEFYPCRDRVFKKTYARVL